MDGFGFLSEELLRASVLVPKRRALQVDEYHTDSARAGSDLCLTVEQRSTSLELERLEPLREQYALEMQRLMEAQEEAKRATQALHSIMDEILKINMGILSGPHTRQASINAPSSVTTASSSVSPPASANLLMTAFNAPSLAAPPPPSTTTPPLLAGLQMQTKAKFLPRKPRSLLFSRAHPNWMLTSTLDGSLQCWSLDRRALDGPSLSLSQALNEACWAEAMCLDVRGQHVAMALGSPTASADAPVPELSTRICVLGINEDSAPRLLVPSHPVHSKGLASVVAFYDGPSERSLFITGGNDKNVALWDSDLSARAAPAATTTTTELHRRHTSAVLALCQQPQTRTLWSGGADMRLVGYCLAKRQTVFETKLDGRLSHILSHAQDPNRLLLALARPSEQFRLLDCRTPTTPSAIFGWAEAGNTSRYLQPSWHHAGNLVACGSASPQGSPPGINIWDLRYLPHPLQRIDAGSADRRFAATIFHPTKDLLVALATDGSVSFIDYTLS